MAGCRAALRRSASVGFLRSWTSWGAPLRLLGRMPDIASILQLAIGPVILISGVGLLLLTMTNRFGRVIDRSRALAAGLESSSEAKRSSMLAQLRILARRARVLRAAIALASTSALLAAVLVITLFFTAWVRCDASVVIAVVFTLCLLSLIASLLLFIRDINASLKALWLEMPPGLDRRD